MSNPRRIVPTVNPELAGDMPSEFDLYWNDEIEFEDMSKKAQKEVSMRFDALTKARELRGEKNG